MEPTWTSDCGTVKKDSRDVTIYVLIEDDTNAIRYVGKTVLPVYRRRVQHQYCARSNKRQTRIARWIRALERAGRSFRIVAVETVASGGEWQAAERQWIANLRNAGCRLVNATDGGEGLAGHVFSEEHRNKISIALRSQVPCLCQHCGSGFTAKPSDIAKGDGKFCSRGCYQEWQRGRKKKSLGKEHGKVVREANARNRRQRQLCKRGHQLTGDNVYLNTKGSRVCKECRKIHKEAYRAKA